MLISPSELKEAGAKFSLLDGNLFGGLAYYEQFRRRTDMLGNVDGTTAKGVELEVHWLASDNLSFAASLTDQERALMHPGPGRGNTFRSARTSSVLITFWDMAARSRSTMLAMCRNWRTDTH